MATKYTNSDLATYVKISPFKNSPRNQPITKITIHHMAGVGSVESFGTIVTTPGRNMSATYAIGNDGRIGRYIDEGDRPWTSSSAWNDNRAITIEVSNSKLNGDWPVSDAAYTSLINLCADICKRNGIKQLTYTGDQNGSLTFHRFFAATACPGEYLFSRAQEICSLVNAKLGLLGSVESKTETPNVNPVQLAAGVLVSINAGATYYDGQNIPSWVSNQRWYVSSISGDRAVLGKNETGNSNIMSPINTKDVTVVQNASAADTSPFQSYTKSVSKGAAIYQVNGTTVHQVSTIPNAGVYTIVNEVTVSGTKYGLLKSGAGWIRLGTDTTPTVDTTINVGDSVEVLRAETYDGKTFKLYESRYKVLQVNGDRVVISSDGKNVTAAVKAVNLRKL